jgi:hypothetical protein
VREKEKGTYASSPQDKEWKMDFNDGAAAAGVNGGSERALLDGKI